MVVGSDVNTYIEEWYFNMLELSALLGKWSHLEELFIGTYKKSTVNNRREEMGRNYIHTGGNGLLIFITSEFIKSNFCMVLYYDWHRVIFVGLLWGFWSLLLVEYILNLALVNKRMIILVWIRDWRLFGKNWYNDYYKDTELLSI